jgi:hypothetical protein
LIGLLASRPALARLYLVESVVVGEPLVELRQRSADRLTALLEPDRAAAVEEGLIGGHPHPARAPCRRRGSRAA